MAAEAQSEGPALAPPPLAHGSSSAPASASPGKRGLPIPGDDGVAEEERRLLPEPKRRRACVAALDSVPTSSVAEKEEAEDSGSGCGGDGDGASFSFQHSRGGFVALETTPKFGSFTPPGEAELAGLDLKPAGHEDEAEAESEVPAASAPGTDGGQRREFAITERRG